MGELFDSIHRKRYRNRMDFSKFKKLIITPVTGAVTFPGNAKVSLKSRAGNAANATAIIVVLNTTRTIKAPALGVNVGWDVLVDNGIGKYFKIASL
jgi:hypothetical protein